MLLSGVGVVTRRIGLSAAGVVLAAVELRLECAPTLLLYRSLHDRPGRGAESHAGATVAITSRLNVGWF